MTTETVAPRCGADDELVELRRRVDELTEAVNRLDREQEFDEEYLEWVDKQLRYLRDAAGFVIRSVWGQKATEPPDITRDETWLYVLRHTYQTVTVPDGPRGMPEQWVERYRRPEWRNRLYGARDGLVEQLKATGARNVGRDSIRWIVNRLRQQGINPPRRDLVPTDGPLRPDNRRER